MPALIESYVDNSTIQLKLNLTKPARDLPLIFNICLTEMCLQGTLLKWNSIIIEEYVPDHESDYESNTSVENYPPKQESQFSEIHRMARERIGPAPQKVIFIQLPFHPLNGRRSRMQSQTPEETDVSNQDWDQ